MQVPTRNGKGVSPMLGVETKADGDGHRQRSEAIELFRPKMHPFCVLEAPSVLPR